MPKSLLSDLCYVAALVTPIKRYIFCLFQTYSIKSRATSILRQIHTKKKFSGNRRKEKLEIFEENLLLSAHYLHFISFFFLCQLRKNMQNKELDKYFRCYLSGVIKKKFLFSLVPFELIKD